MGESGKRTENIKEESVNLNNSTAMQKLPPLRLPKRLGANKQRSNLWPIKLMMLITNCQQWCAKAKAKVKAKEEEGKRELCQIADIAAAAAAAKK